MMELKSVGEILNDKLVVPEIQRDYVWGANKSNPDIVRNFVLDLNEKAKKNEVSQLGFLYSYAHGGELHLIDGQQRMTTLVLLTFFCACKDGDETGEIMETVGHFSYRVRVDTENFMHSLFAHIDDFSKDLSLFSESKLRDYTWYRAKYNQDTTIVSMVKTLDTFYNLFKSLEDGFCLTSAWILKCLSFWTFEVAQTSQGEELYISMNSRGESLTDSELLKPRLFERANDYSCTTAKSWGKAWDNWEEFIFSHRKGNTVESVSEALNTFLRIVIELETGEPHARIEPAKDASLVNLAIIEKYFECLKSICDQDVFHDEVLELYDTKKYSRLVLKVLLILYLVGTDIEEIKRIYPIIKNWGRRKLMKNEALLKALHAFVSQSSPKLGWLDFVIGQVKPNEHEVDGIIDHHELLKIKRYQQNRGNDLEALYHKAEQNPLLNGYLRAIWSEAFDDGFVWDDSSLAVFQERFSVFEAVFSEKHITVLLSRSPQNDRVDNSLISRALFSLPDANGDSYGVHVGGSNWTYGYNQDWREIMNSPSASRFVSRLLNEIHPSDVFTLAKKLNEIIVSHKDVFKKSDARYYITGYPTSLMAIKEGYNRLGFSGDWDNFGVWVISMNDMRSPYVNMFTGLLYRELKEENPDISYSGPWGFYLKNDLQFLCSTLQGWDVRYEKWVNDRDSNRISVLKERLTALMGTDRVIDNEDTKKRKQFFIRRIGDEDQIELGKKIFDCIKTL